MLCYVMLCYGYGNVYVMLCYVMAMLRCYVMVCYVTVMLCYVIYTYISEYIQTFSSPLQSLMFSSPQRRSAYSTGSFGMSC